MKKKHHPQSSKKIAVTAIRSGISVDHTARIHKCHRTTLWRWMSASNGGKKISNLKTKSRSGRPIAITDLILIEFKKDVLKPATKFGFETDFWTAKRVQIHLKRKFNIKVTVRTVRRWLKKCHLSYHKPERIYYEADKNAQKNWVNNELPKIINFARKINGVLYFEDEACIQLSPVVGKTWGPIGKTLVRTVTGNKSSISAISAITKSGNLIFRLLDKKIKSPEIIDFLSNMLKHHPQRKVVVVMDRAKPHISKMTKEFIAKQKRLYVFYLPARSPKLNPDEKVWSHLKHQELRDHQATTKKSLTKIVGKKLLCMSKNKKLIKGIFYRCDVAKYMS